MQEPSVWTNVGFSPLSRDPRMIFQRNGKAEFVFPSAVRRKGGDTMHPSDKAVVSLLIAFDESAGRFYSGLLVAAPDEALHKYCKSASSRALQKDSSTMSPPLSRPCSRELSRPRSRAGTDVEAGSPDSRTRSIKEASSPSVRTFLGRELGRARSRTDSEGAERSKTASPFEKLWEDTEAVPTDDTEWPYMLLYAVKEGVLAHFSADRGDCVEVVRAIAISYASGQETGLDDSQPGKDGVPPLAPPPGEVKIVDHVVGPVLPPCARHLSNIIGADIRRRFAARCDPEDQPDFTNCAAFCLRLLTAFKHSFRSHDIHRICEARPELGRLAGEAAGAACERLLRALRYDQTLPQPK